MNKPTPYQQRVINQGRNWVNGRSVHEPVNDECTPDFSCCAPELFTQNRADRLQCFNSWAARHGFALLTDS